MKHLVVFDFITQLVEYYTFNVGVASSSLAGVTIIYVKFLNIINIMTINTKYSIGDKVWTMIDNKPEEITIIKIMVDFKKDSIKIIYADLKDIYSEEKLYPTKDELKDAIFNE